MLWEAADNAPSHYISRSLPVQVRATSDREGRDRDGDREERDREKNGERGEQRVE
jgi:hypothetical protein